ncbi:putative Rossmann fold enzyme [Methanomicrobium sp. W14]|uniref:6-hydroxymethylpterin diphosphokinase MptE-like protein n=1 Tax=Methanomicrobium sp. W14 TaxID=2817839 RepID=UPI001AE1DA5E|nr:6-hydroxymethylpterin diphosphokinase MptE-like protein [Methanomicrobium sp. W14]MBP2133048.1 putative Rossmann fold enzyme [Methanomicrobium sp. W14]
MKFDEWEPHYLRILDYFGFDRESDERAAETARSLTDKDDIEFLRSACLGKKVTVCGNAPSLKKDIKKIDGVVFAADAAADFLYRAGIRPDIVSTDLDGCEETFVEMSLKGTIMVVHAHGDNIPLLKNWIPRFNGPVVLTTQSRPFDCVYNFGGFTDGDRAVFTALEMGAGEVNLAGFDLDDRSVDPVKRGKLLIARKLLSNIGYDI